MTPEQVYCNTTPFKRTQLHWLQHDHHQEFYIRSIHESADGLGIVYLMNQFLELVVASEREEALQKDDLLKLAPPLRIAANLGPESYAEEARKVLQQYNADVKVSAVFLRGKVSTSDAAQPARLDMDMDMSTNVTTSILKACKENGITITHAFHAALALSMMKLNPPPKGRSVYPFDLSINIRDTLQAPYRGSKQPAALYSTSHFTSIPMPEHRVNLKEIFLPLARDFRDSYTKVREDPHLIAMQKTIFDTIIRSAQTQTEGQGAAPEIIPGPSNYGNLDKALKTKYHENLVVERFFYGVQMRGSSQMAIWTYQGQFHMAFCFDHGDLDETILKELMAVTVETLLSSLGVAR